MPLSTQTYQGTPGGMNLAKPAQSLDDNEARYLQDVLLDYPGLIRMRGPLKAGTGLPTVSDKMAGILATLDPQGTLRTAVLHGDTTHGYFGALSASGTSLVDVPWGANIGGSPPNNPYVWFSAKAGLTGGTWVGTSTTLDNTATQQLALWRGGNKADYTTGSLSFTRGSTTVTGSGTAWAANVVPGMFLFAQTDAGLNDGGAFTNYTSGVTGTYIGVVAKVNSDTQIILGAAAPYTATGKTYTLTALRGFHPRVVKGYVTCDTTGTTVTGAKTKFKAQGLGTGTWNLYRLSDLAWIGGVSSVTNDSSLTLRVNAAISMANEAYVAIRADADFSRSTITTTNNKVGFLTAVYAERQWYGNNGSNYDNTSKVWFSDSNDPEAVDMDTSAGDFISIGSTTGVNSPIRALQTAYNALCILKEDEVFAIYGSSPSQFNVKKISDDGTISGLSVQPYQGGVIWAGKDGIEFYDGIQVTNITQDKLGDYYKNLLRTVDPSKYRMWSMIARDHYFLFLENCSPSIPVVKGTVSTTPTAFTICIYLPNRAITTHTNLGVRGAVELPQSSGIQTWFVANSSTTGYICDTADLFDTIGRDSITGVGQVAGPDPYMESKKFDFGDGLRKKLFKQLALNYLSQGDSLTLDTVTGLNSIGRTSLSTYPATVYSWDQLRILFTSWNGVKNVYPTWNALIQAVFKPKRLKFLKRTQHLAFRIYSTTGTVQRFQLGPFQLGFKFQRPGRI